MKDHLMVFEDDGALFDLRDVDLLQRPLRANYSRHHERLRSLADIKASLRAGPFAWPGGYPLYFISEDGAALAFETIRENWRQVVWDYLNDCNTGWRLAGVAINYEEPNMLCDHSAKPIDAAYV